MHGSLHPYARVPPNGISAGSAVLSRQCVTDTDRQTDRHTDHAAPTNASQAQFASSTVGTASDVG